MRQNVFICHESVKIKNKTSVYVLFIIIIIIIFAQNASFRIIKNTLILMLIIKSYKHLIKNLYI